MKITKFVHACVLVEDDEHVGLFDPGEFSLQSGLFNFEENSKLDFIFITHEHFDHFSPEFVKKLIQKFPEVKFYSNPSVAKMLKELGAKEICITSDQIVKQQHLDHQSMEPLSSPPICDNYEIHFKNLISHPGDSQQMQSSKDILLMPLAGPWGSAIDGIRMATRLKPKYVLPIHDWMWNENWRQTMYHRMADFFASQNIKFLMPVDSQSIEIKL